MKDYSELKRLAEDASPGPWFRENDDLYFKDEGYTRFMMACDPGNDIPDDGEEHADNLRFIAAANPVAVLAMIAEIERLIAQWGDRPAYRTPEYESRRDAMWRRAHMVATSKGYDHINMAIAAAPTACSECMGCGGEWQGDGLPSAVCEVCNGSRGKALELERDQLKAENEALRKDRDTALIALGISLDEWSKLSGKSSGPRPNTGHGHVFPRADGVRARCGGPGMCKECSADKARKEAGQ